MRSILFRLCGMLVVTACGLPRVAGASGPDVGNDRLEPAAFRVEHLGRLDGAAGSWVAISGDGSAISTAGKTEARVWDARTLKPLSGILKHDHPVSFASISDNGRVLATGSGKQVMVWDVPSGRRTATLAYTGNVIDGSISPDGSLLVTTDGGNSARVYETKTGRAVSTLTLEDPINRVLFNPDGRSVITAGSGVFVWDPATGRKQVEHAGGAAAPGRSQRPLAVSSDGNWLATVEQRCVVVARCSQEKSFLAIDTIDASLGIVEVVCFDGKPTKLFTAGTGGIAIWDLVTGKDVAGYLSVGMRSRVSDACLSADGRLVLVATDTDDSGLWDTVTGNPVFRFRETPANPPRIRWTLKRPIPMIAMSPSGKLVLATYPDENSTEVWRISRGAEIRK